MSTPISLTISTSFGDVPLSADERGGGRAVVILHGGAGPVSVTGFADLLADATGTRVIVPTHPGFGGTPRPGALTTVDGLAEVYAGLLDALELEDATVIGNSIGGWIASELALRQPARLGRFALVDAVGVEVEGTPSLTRSRPRNSPSTAGTTRPRPRAWTLRRCHPPSGRSSTVTAQLSPCTAVR